MGTVQKIEWEKLVAKAIDNDQFAIEQLYNATYSQAFSVAIQMMKNEQDAMDVLQDAYVKAFASLQSLQEPGKFKSWFNCIVANRCRDYLRKRKDIVFSDVEVGEDIEFEDTLESDAVEFSPEASVDYSETKRLVNEILQGLPEEQKLCVLMFYYNELSVKEIAKTLDCSENTVKSRLNYARKKIKEDVQALAKKGTKLFGIAPIPFLVWMLRGAEAETTATVVAPQVWAAVQGAGTAATTSAAAATSTAATTTAAATSAGAASTAAATGTAATTGAVAAGIGATKVGLIVAGVVAAAAVAGGTVGVTVYNNHSNAMASSDPARIEVSQTKEFMSIEAGSQLNIAPADFLSFDASIAQDIQVDVSAVDVSKVGEYEVVASYDGEKYILTVLVEDTTVPALTLTERVFYHTEETQWDALTVAIAEVKDCSVTSQEVVGYQFLADLSDVTVDYLTELRSNVPTVPSTEGLTSTFPTKSGVYRLVISVKDIYDNQTQAEVYLIFGESEDEEIDIQEVLNESAEQVPHEDTPVVPEPTPEVPETTDPVVEEEVAEPEEEVVEEEVVETTPSVTYNTVMLENDDSGTPCYTVYIETTSSSTASSKGKPYLYDYLVGMECWPGTFNTTKYSDTAYRVSTAVANTTRISITVKYNCVDGKSYVSSGSVSSNNWNNYISSSCGGYSYSEAGTACGEAALNDHLATCDGTCSNSYASRTYYLYEIKSLLGV